MGKCAKEKDSTEKNPGAADGAPVLVDEWMLM
jgi:hypothetical protein